MMTRSAPVEIALRALMLVAGLSGLDGSRAASWALAVCGALQGLLVFALANWPSNQC